MNNVTITRDEATRILHTLRTLQMILPSELMTLELAGELQTAISNLEGDIWSSSVIEMPGNNPHHGAAASALGQFTATFIEKWQPSSGEHFRADVETLLTLAQLAERESIGPEPSVN